MAVVIFGEKSFEAFPPLGTKVWLSERTNSFLYGGEPLRGDGKREVKRIGSAASCMDSALECWSFEVVRRHSWAL